MDNVVVVMADSFKNVYSEEYSSWVKANQAVDIFWYEIVDSYNEWCPELDAMQEEVEVAYRSADSELRKVAIEFLKKYSDDGEIEKDMLDYFMGFVQGEELDKVK